MNRQPYALVGLSAFILSIADCGQSSFQKELEDIAQAKEVSPVTSESLQSLFPLLDGWHKGWTRDDPVSAEMIKQGFKPETCTGASVAYTQVPPGLRIEARLSDCVMLVKSWAERNEKDVREGYLRRARIAGFPAWERWDGPSLHGELWVAVNKRFVFWAEGEMESLKVLHELAEKINLKQLAALK